MTSVILLFSSSWTLGQSDELSAQEIVDRAVARSESQMELNTELQFRAYLLSEVESLDGEGTVTKTESSLYERYPIHGAIHEELIEKDGRPLTDKEKEEEKEKRDKFRQEVKERVSKGKPPQPEDEQRVHFNQEFMSRYNTKLVGEERIRDYFCWVIQFEPREGDLPVERRLDEALNRSTGKLWISQEDFGLVRVEFEMREPIRYLAGILATVRDTVGRLEFDRIEEDVWFPVDFELALDMRILFKNIRRNIKLNWRVYQRIAPAEFPGCSGQDVLTQSN